MSKETKRERRWLSPNKRAETYAAELKNKVHMHGPKEGQPLTDKEACLRIGALQMKNDHIGIYKYKKALEEGMTKAEAKAFSKTIGKKK